MKAFITRDFPLPAFKAMLASLQAMGATVDLWSEDRPIPRDELLKRVHGVDGLYCLLSETINAELMDAAGPQIKVISLENVVIVPHVGSATIQTRDKMASLAANNLIAGLEGERLPNCANPEVYS